MQSFEMLFPDSFAEAGNLILEHNAKPIAGGTALSTLMKENVFQPETLVNLRNLGKDHDYIERDGDTLRIGALTTLRDIETSSLVAEQTPVVSECLSEVASIRIRNVATIGGNLAHSDPDLDLPPVLAGLDARIVVGGPNGERTVDIKDFILGYYNTDLEDGELVKGLEIPINPGLDCAYLKHRSLSEADWPCVGVAAFHDGHVPQVYVNAVADTPIFQPDGLAEVFDDGVTAAAITAAGDLVHEQCDPIGDARGSAWYKRRMAKEFAERALRKVTDVSEATKVHI